MSAPSLSCRQLLRLTLLCAARFTLALDVIVVNVAPPAIRNDLLTVMGRPSFEPSIVARTSGISDEQDGLASGLLGTSQELGAAVGLAKLSALAAVGGGR